MDIDLLWVSGGWFLFFDCMATTKTTSSPLFFSLKSHSKPYLNCFAFLGILVILFLLSSPLDRAVLPHNASMVSSRRLLSEDNSNSMDFHPTPTKTTRQRSPSSSHGRAHRQFEASAHEVPSGPNPISNR